MTRVIPKRSKLNVTVWKSFTLLDFVAAFILLLLVAVIALSNLPGKWYMCISAIPLAVLMLASDGEGGRAYTELISLIRFLFSRKRFSAKAGNVAAIVPDAVIREDGLLDYGEYVGVVVAIDSVGFELKSEWQQNACISAFAAMFNALSDGESAQIVKLDRPINFDEIAERTFEKLRTAMRNGDAAAKQLILRSRLCQLDELNNVTKQYRPFYYVVLYSSSVQSVAELYEAAASTLDACGLRPRPLGAKDVAVFLKYCYTRDFDEREIENVPPERYLEYIRPNYVKFGFKDCISDGRESFTFAVSDYPLEVENAWGAGLFNIENTKTVMNIRPVDRYKAIKRIDRTITELVGQDKGKRSEQHAQGTHLATMDVLLQSLQNENEMLFDCALTVTAYNNDGESPAAFRKRVRRAMTAASFKVSQLRARQLDGFISSSITAREPLKKYMRGINSESLAAVFPFVFTSIIEPQGMTLGESDGYPFIFDPWKWQYSRGEFLNANMFVAGTPGSGKSYFAKSLLAQMYSDNCVIYALDPENEYKHLCRNVGGRFLDVGNATTGRINPFHIYQVLSDNEDERGEPVPLPPDAVFESHLLYLDNFLSVTLPGINSDALEEINNLIVKCYAEKGITQDTDCSDFTPDRFPIFEDLYELVKSELKKEKSGIRYSNLQRAETYLAKFAKGGRFSNLWNGATTLEQSDKFTVFNFQSLFAAKNKVTSNGQMLTVLRFLEQQIINLREINSMRERDEWIHPVVVLDEGYMFIDEKNTCALDFVCQWYKRIRKYGGSMIFLTQNLADIVGNDEIIAKTSGIINNAQYSFIMTLQGKDIEVLQDIFAARNLTQAEIEEIQRTNKPKGTAFFMGSSAQRAMLHVVTADDVETLFSRTVDAEHMLAMRGIVSEQPAEPVEPSDDESTKEKNSDDVDKPAEQMV